MTESNEFNFKVYRNDSERYGLVISDKNGKILREYRDISDDGERIAKFAEKCNAAQISEEHLDNIVEDFIYLLV